MIMSGRDASPLVVVALGAALAQAISRRYGAQRRPGTLVDAEMWVTPEVWERVSELVQEASKLIHAEALPPRTEGTVHVNLTVGAFQMDAVATEGQAR